MGLVRNIVRVMRLGYEIDGKLVTAYYVTAAVGAAAPIGAAFLLKFAIDGLISANPGTEATALIMGAIAGYFLVR